MRFCYKLIISITLLIAIAFGIGGAMLISASFAASLDEEKQAAMQSFETVQNTLYLLNSLGEKTAYTHMADALSQMEQQGAAWQAVSLRAGEEVIYSSGGTSAILRSLPQPEWGKCAYTISQDDQGYGLHITSTLEAGEQMLTLSARFDLSGAYKTRQTQQRMFLLIYTAVVLLGIITSSVLAVSLTRRLRRLTSTVRQISGGDLSQRSRIQSQDEFGQLSRDFDAMADRLQDNISRLEEDVQRQEAFMGAFAHEIKTPMTSIIGYADLLRQDSLDTDGRMMAADYIFSEGQRLEKLSIIRNGVVLYPNEDISAVRSTKEEIMGCGLDVLNTYQNAGLIWEEMDALAEECVPVVAVSSNAPEKLVAAWYLHMENTANGAELGMTIDDETGQLLMIDYYSPEERGWDYQAVCYELYSLYMQGKDDSALTAIEPAYEETEDMYAYNYAAMYVSWGDVNYGEVILRFTVSGTGFYVSFY